MLEFILPSDKRGLLYNNTIPRQAHGTGNNTVIGSSPIGGANFKNQQIMTQLFDSLLHEENRSHVVHIFDFHGKNIKFIYESYNAVEKFNIEIFDGYKWNHFLSMLDLGYMPETNIYLFKKKRIIKETVLYKEAIEVIKKIL